MNEPPTQIRSLTSNSIPCATCENGNHCVQLIMEDMFDHFVLAQEPIYDRVRAELKAGRKESHWMWFIFPQIRGLGSSPMAERFALDSIQSAAAYLAHPLLGARIVECTQLLLEHGDKSARDMLGTPDDLKLKSSMTLFDCASQVPCFSDVLDQFFDGERCQHTLSFRGGS